MAISEEAYEYLRELEENPNWRHLPEDDMRIVKLRLFFKSNDPRDYRKGAERKPLRVHLKDGGTRDFESAAECAQVMNLRMKSINNAISAKQKLKGHVFERLEELE